MAALTNLTVMVKVLDLKETRRVLREAAREIKRLRKLVAERETVNIDARGADLQSARAIVKAVQRAKRRGLL